MVHDPHDPDILNIGEAAAFLGAHEQTIRKLARRGAIPAFKVGRDWRFRRDSILRWSEKQPLEGGQCSVLVVDDEETVCKTLVRIVKRLGCRGRQALSGAEALQLVAQEVPDLILLDLLMPDMSGVQFLEELRETHPALPVVIITGYPDSDLMEDAAQYAPIMLLAKPVAPELLERTVRTVVGDKLASARPA